MSTETPSLSWRGLYLVTFLAAYLYVFSEWLFAITKPSFMDDWGLLSQFAIFLTISALLTGCLFLCLLPLVILSFVPLLKQYTGLLIALGGWLPALIFAALILMMTDNFTYTVFTFGIVWTDGWKRAVYGVGFILVMVLCYWRILKMLGGLSHRPKMWGFSPRLIFSLLAGLLLFSAAILTFHNQTKAPALSFASAAGAKLRPHILFVTSDAVEANHMSAYGYGRETTPRIQELLQSALVAENAFANSAKTSGSVISIYTGKYPSETRVFFPPDALKGHDRYEHLPGILRSQGYRTVQIAFPYYLDANILNVSGGFDEIRTTGSHNKYLDAISKVLPNEEARFTYETINRIVDRCRHIFFIAKMINPYSLVTGVAEPLEDRDRLEL